MTQLSTEVNALLGDLTAAVDAQQSTETGDPITEELAAVAERADKLVSETETADLMAAVGLGEADTAPESLPAAVAEGDPQNVAAFRSLLTASKLPRSTADHERLVDELASLVETVEDGSPAEQTAVDASEDDPADADTDSEDETAQKTDSDESTSPLRELLQSELEDTFDVFDQVPEIGSLTADDGGDESEDTEKTDNDGAEDDEDDSLLDTDQSSRSGDGTRWRPGGGTQRTTHSTIPSTGRRDIGRSGRFSSVRGSTVSKR